MTVYQRHNISHFPLSLRYVHYIQLSVQFLHSLFLVNGTLHFPSQLSNAFHEIPIRLLAVMEPQQQPRVTSHVKKEIISGFSLSHLNHFTTS